MTQKAATAFVATSTFFVVLSLSWFISDAGLLSDDAVSLWANAIAAGDGDMPVGRVVAAYPTIPFLATALLELVSPTGTPTPVLLAAGLLGAVAAIWLNLFRRLGLALPLTIMLVLLIALHPAMLRAAIAGPAEMFFAAFLFLLVGALYDLRARSAAPEVMAVALTLLGLAFSHPMGAAFACAATPLLVFTVRPELVAKSAFNVVIALVFPTVFCVFAFSYMSWVFPGSGWSFLVAPAEGIANWSASMSRTLGSGLTGLSPLDAGVVTFLAIFCAPHYFQ
jgi:hypothetical protein